MFEPLGTSTFHALTPPKKNNLDANGSILILRRAEEEVIIWITQ
jgi:hypothetical protein